MSQVHTTKQLTAKKNEFVKAKVVDYENKIIKTNKEIEKETIEEHQNEEITQEEKINKEKRTDGTPNNLTSLVGGTLNVMSCRSEMMSYITNILNLKFKINRAHCAYSLIVEMLLIQFTRMSGKYNNENSEKANLYEVKTENIQRAIRENKELTNEIKMLSENYNPKGYNYLNKFYTGAKKLKEFLQTKTFENKVNIEYSYDTQNYLCYLVNSIMLMITKTACNFSLFANKKVIGIKNFKYSCGEYFNGELYNLIIQRLQEIETKFSGMKKSVGDIHNNEDCYEDCDDEDEIKE